MRKTAKGFFKEIDKLVKKDLSCHEFSMLYYDFFYELKNWRGTSAGFM